MFRNYFKITIRSLYKNKGYSFLNIFGLAIGIACAALIFLWVEDEAHWDDFNVKKDHLYFIRENQKYDAYTATFGSTPGVLAPAMQAEIPGIAATCRTYDMDDVLFTIGDKKMYANGLFTDASLFSMFTLPFVQGNAATAMAQRYSLVITEKTAKKFFGTVKDVVGKTVQMDNKQDYIITGVVKDIPSNSSLHFEFVGSFQIVFDQNSYLHRWGNNSLNTYVELKPGASAASVNKILYNFIQQREPSSNARPFLWSMSRWHLYDQFDNGVETGGGQIEYVHLFAIIAWIILFIACINFMNLATARSEKRAREVGVRKVLGAGKENLVMQFIGEAVLMAAVSAVLAVVIMVIALPFFNTLVQKDISPGFDQPLHIIALVSLTLICGLLAGSYPSFYLSSFNPVFVLKGIKTKGGSAAIIRKVLVVVQFSVSVILIVSTLIIYQQIQHVKSRNLGFNKNNLLQISAQGDVPKYYNSLKQDLLATNVVENVAMSDHGTLWGGNNTGSLTWPGKAQDAQILISNRYVTEGFFKTSGISLLEGRDLTSTDSVQSKHLNAVITQSFEKLMGKGSALGNVIRWQNDTSGTTMTVVGVVNDYVYGNMYGKPDPMIFYSSPLEHVNLMYVRLKPEASTEAALAKIEMTMKKNNPAYPFIYKFVDEQFNNMFYSEALIGKLSQVFAALAIIISCLGLFGLAAYTAERRTKEIGVRKVLGASVSGIAALLSKDFLQLVVLSCLVAFPLAWWMMHSWLQGFEYRIAISGWIFFAAGLVAVLIAFITVSFQAIKAALANPVKSLRTE